jgi:hypothetical protein
VFIAGTEPVGACPLHGAKGDRTTVSGWDIPPAGQPSNPPSPPSSPSFEALPPPRRDNGSQLPAVTSQVPGDRQPPAEKEKKKGFFGKLKDVFR